MSTDAKLCNLIYRATQVSAANSPEVLKVAILRACEDEVVGALLLAPSQPNVYAQPVVYEWTSRTSRLKHIFDPMGPAYAAVLSERPGSLASIMPNSQLADPEDVLPALASIMADSQPADPGDVLPALGPVTDLDDDELPALIPFRRSTPALIPFRRSRHLPPWKRQEKRARLDKTVRHSALQRTLDSVNALATDAHVAQDL